MNNASQNKQEPNQNMVISYLTIRKAVGWLGILFPVVLASGTWLIGKCPCLRDSVSAYYYTVMISYFSGTLCAVALFLFTYKGYDQVDQLLSNAAAVFALCIVFLPTNVSHTCGDCNFLTKPDNSFLNTAHYLTAGVFFVLMACMSLFLFTKTKPGEQPTKQKRQRNMVYKTCGIVMLVSMALIPCLKIKAIPASFFTYKPEFWMEAIVLWAFGISWLTKGEGLLKDE